MKATHDRMLGKSGKAFWVNGCKRLAVVLAFFEITIAAAAPLPPLADNLDPAVVRLAARAAMARGVTYLKDCATADQDGWIVPPLRTQVPIGTTNLVVSYRERKTPKYEYETYTAYEHQAGSDSLSTTVVPVQRKRIKRVIDPEGGPVELVADPKGPIKKAVTRNVYGPGGQDYWRFGVLGQNAMALYALRVAGVAGDDAIVQKTAENLRMFVQSYGMPDSTWDLAWFAAAFARLPGEEDDSLTRELASKLLNGQITDGPACGLWGPASINFSQLGSLCLKELALGENLRKARESEKGLPETRKTGQRVPKLEEEMKALQADMRRVSMLAHTYDRIDNNEIKIGKAEGMPLLVCGLPDYIFNQTSADIECTALALFALREVSRAGRLPGQTSRPQTSQGAGKATLSPEFTEAAMVRAANAIAQLQQPDGSWTESSMHQPVKEFDGLGKRVTGIPVKADSFKPLPSTQTPFSSLCGYSALVDIAGIMGYARVQARFQPKLAAGAAQAGADAKAIPDFRPEAKAGGFSPPFGAYFQAGNALVEPGTSRLVVSNELLRMVADVVNRLGKGGAWEGDGFERALIKCASTRARMATLAKKDPKDRSKLMDRSAACISANWGQDPGRTVDTKVLATSYSLAFLANHVRPPIAVCRVGEGAPLPPALEPVLKALEPQVGIPWPYVELIWPLKPSDLDIAPLLFVSGTGDFAADEATRSALAGFFKCGGFVIVQAPATAEGETFLQSAGVVLASCGEAEPPGDVSSDARVLGDLAGTLGCPLRGVLRKDGSLVAALVPVAGSGPAAKNAFSPAATAKLTRALVERNINPALLAPDYAWNLGDLGDATNVYESAMAMLRSPKGNRKGPAEVPGPGLQGKATLKSL